MQRYAWLGFNLLMMFVEFIGPTSLCVLAFYVTTRELGAIQAIAAFVTLVAVIGHYQTQVVASAAASLVFGVLMILKMIYQMDWMTEESGRANCVGTMPLDYKLNKQLF